MKTYEKVLIVIDAILTALYSLAVLGGSGFNADGIGTLFGGLLILFLLPYAVSFVVSKLSKSENKKLVLWQTFIKMYLAFLILIIIGALNK